MTGTFETKPLKHPQNGRLGQMANSVFETSHVSICFNRQEMPAALLKHVFHRRVSKHAPREEVRAETKQPPPLRWGCCFIPYPAAFLRPQKATAHGCPGAGPRTLNPLWPRVEGAQHGAVAWSRVSTTFTGPSPRQRPRRVAPERPTNLVTKML
jgi:hypothetical protein